MSHYTDEDYDYYEDKYVQRRKNIFHSYNIYVNVDICQADDECHSKWMRMIAETKKNERK